MLKHICKFKVVCMPDGLGRIGCRLNACMICCIESFVVVIVPITDFIISISIFDFVLDMSFMDCSCKIKLPALFSMIKIAADLGLIILTVPRARWILDFGNMATLCVISRPLNWHSIIADASGNTL